MARHKPGESMRSLTINHITQLKMKLSNVSIYYLLEGIAATHNDENLGPKEGFLKVLYEMEFPKDVVDQLIRAHSVHQLMPVKDEAHYEDYLHQIDNIIYDCTEKANDNNDYLQGVKDAARVINKKMIDLHTKADEGLLKLNETAERLCKQQDIKDRWSVTEEYYQSVATFAWGYRGQKISLLYLDGTVSQLLTNPETIKA